MLQHKADPGPQPQNARRVDRSGLQQVGQKVRHLRLHREAAGAALQKGSGQQVAVDDQKSRSRRAVQALVPGQAEVVDGAFLQIDVQKPRRLRGVHRHQHPAAARHRADLLHRHPHTKDVGALGADNQAGVWADQMLKVPDHLFVAGTGLGDAVGNQPLPGQRVHHPVDRVVLKVGDNHMVPRPQHALDDDVQRLGAVFGKNHLLRLAAKELRGQLPAAVHPLGRFDGEVVTAPSGIGAVAHQRLLHRLCHAGRLWKGGGRIVKVDHLPPPSSPFWDLRARRMPFCISSARAISALSSPPRMVSL